MQHDLTQINTNFPKDLFDKGQNLAQLHAVHDLSCKNQGIVISGRVFDSPNHVSEDSSSPGESHRVFININPNKRSLFEGECSCDLGENCEHVVATLIAALQPELINTGTTTSDDTKNSGDNSSVDETNDSADQEDGQWLDKIRTSQQTQISLKPTLNTYYALHITDSIGAITFGQPQLSLEVFVAKSINHKNATQRLLTEKTKLTLDQHITAHPPRFFTPIDLEILSVILRKTKKFELPNPVDITSFANSDFLQLILKCERCSLTLPDSNTDSTQDMGNRTPHWMKLDESSFELPFTSLLNGPTKSLHAIWHINQRGNQWLSLNRPKLGLAVFGNHKPFYLDLNQNEWGKISTDLNKDALDLINSGLVLTPDDVDPFLTAIARKVEAAPPNDNGKTRVIRVSSVYKNNQLPLPLQLPRQLSRDLIPTPVLRLYSRRISTVVDNSYRRPAFIDGAALYFDYN